MNKYYSTGVSYIVILQSPSAPLAPPRTPHSNFPNHGTNHSVRAGVLLSRGAVSGMGIAHLGVNKPELIMKSIVPVVMAGVLGIYGLIIAVIIANAVTPPEGSKPAYSWFSATAHFGGGVACGLSGLAAGLAIGVTGDCMTRASAEQPKLFVGMVLILIFAEALGLYGLIVGLILASKA
ncbi:hypothetical protein AB1Y20_017709 [Prymnesium parvum]|uniref:V-type proton ATPase proteolipid subunit n=1 Tax=Prymnesium parvum TaxID=97485 RepID=A0AB34JQ72_PRYPA